MPDIQDPAMGHQASVCSTNSLPSYFMQKQLNINANIVNDFFSVVAKGDIAAVKKLENRIGLDVQYQIEAESG